MIKFSDSLVPLICDCIEQAGNILITERENFTVRENQGRGNFTTSADLKSEALLMQKLKEIMPGVSILSEESISEIKNPLTAESLFVIDPLDGTNNYRHYDCYSCVSVGYLEKGELIAAFVRNPFRAETFIAIKGQGAFLNSRRIETGNLNNISNGRLFFENSYQPEDTIRLMEMIKKINPLPWIINKGSSVLNICDIAAARADAMIHNCLKPWDLAAALLILRESGGRIINFDGQEATIMDTEIICGNPVLVDQIYSNIHS